MKAEIQKFKVKGKVYVWKYKDNDKNYPGWNLTVDEDGSDSLTELLTLMDNCEWSSRENSFNRCAIRVATQGAK